MTYPTPDEESAEKLDNELYARAAKLEIVEVPPEVTATGGVTPETVESWLTSQDGPFAVVPGQGISIWHAITNWGHPGTWFNVLDKRTTPPTVQRVYTGDTVIVKFQDGTTWEVQFLGPPAPAGQIFMKVPNSERDENGDPLQGSVGGSPSSQGTSLFLAYETFDIETEPTLDCAVLASVTSCEVLYGVNTCETVKRAVAVPCSW